MRSNEITYMTGRGEDTKTGHRGKTAPWRGDRDGVMLQKTREWRIWGAAPKAGRNDSPYRQQRENSRAGTLI